MSASRPTLDPLHPCRELSFQVLSLATGNQTQEPPEPLRFFLSRKLAPTGSWLSPGHPLVPVRTATDYTSVSFTEHSRATVLPGPARQLNPQRYALCFSASAIVREEHLNLAWWQGPDLNSLTFGLMTQEETEPHPALW